MFLDNSVLGVFQAGFPLDAPATQRPRRPEFRCELAHDLQRWLRQQANMHIALLVGGARYADVTGDATETAASTNFWNIVTGTSASRVRRFS